MSFSLPIRTRVFGFALAKLGKSVDQLDPTEFAAQRTKRAKLQASRLGRYVFGTADPDCVIEDQLMDLDGVELRVRTYRPSHAADTILPVVVLFHGGGWVQGSPEQNDWMASRVALRVNAAVVSVAYRLAPEHPFPAAVDDCWNALRSVHDNAAALGVDAERLAVMGDSAGGNLAAVVAMRARDAGGPRLRLQVLIYPGTEMIDKYDSEIRNAEAPVLTSRTMRTFSAIYLAGADGTLPEAAPIRAESHEDLAPALIQTAGHDPLLDNGRLYAEKLLESGVKVTYTCYEDAVHGYISLPGIVPTAEQALEQIVRCLRKALD